MREHFLLAALLAACAAEPGEESAARTRAAILGGRPSGDDENAAVYIETMGANGLARCSGRIVAPGLVLTARHCVVRARAITAYCNTDGSPKGGVDTTDLSLEPASAITVFVGAHKPSARRVGVREIVTELEVSICRSDLAFLVLAEPALETRTPIRKERVKIGEKLQISGWGYTSDERVALPDDRSTLDAVPVTEVGPGAIPDGAFATAGNTVCFGDSGAVALVDRAAVGIYSRIDDPEICSLEFGRNVFTSLHAHVPLVELAYEKIGEEPWYAGDRPPWLAPPGAACTADDACRSAVCDAGTKTCAAPCGASGLACTSDAVCDPATSVCAPRPAPAPRETSSCSAARAAHARSVGVVPGFLVLCALARRRRRTSRSTAESEQEC